MTSRPLGEKVAVITSAGRGIGRFGSSTTFGGSIGTRDVRVQGAFPGLGDSLSLSPWGPSTLLPISPEGCGYWQRIAGGGENDELPADAARREATEEAGYTNSGDLFQLQSMTTVPVAGIAGFIWGEHVLLVVEHSFAIRAATLNITLSSEHDEYRWCDYETAMAMLKWDSNRTALWELNHRVLHCLQTLDPA